MPFNYFLILRFENIYLYLGILSIFFINYLQRKKKVDDKTGQVRMYAWRILTSRNLHYVKERKSKFHLLEKRSRQSKNPKKFETKRTRYSGNNGSLSMS